jgi:diacylglycerol kinase (ATP)
VNERYLAIVNPASGGGRCRKLIGPVMMRLNAASLHIDIAETKAQGDATRFARDAYKNGYRHFIAVGGDGTSYEIINGLFPLADPADRPTLGFLPLGTGNSFLRDFSDQGVDHAEKALIIGHTRPCDVIRLRYKGGELYYINLLSVGFTADVAAFRARYMSRFGHLGYFFSIFTCLARLRRRPFPLKFEGSTDIDRRRALFLTFNNSKYTGGTMMIAPKAEVSDGLIEYVRWGPIGRAGLIKNLPTLYDGTHINHPLAEHHAVKRIDFDLEGPVDVMVDGEVLTLQCESLDVLPSALNVVV